MYCHFKRIKSARLKVALKEIHVVKTIRLDLGIESEPAVHQCRDGFDDQMVKGNGSGPFDPERVPAFSDMAHRLISRAASTRGVVRGLSP
jgi:hypothetical protein